MITGKKGFSWGVAAAVLLASAACSHKKSGGESAASDAEGGGSPVAVQFTQGEGSGAAGPSGLSLADVSGRQDFGGTLAVTSYNIDLACAGGIYKLQGGRMIVRSDASDCASKVTEITVADQHGLIAKFSSSDPDAAIGSKEMAQVGGVDDHQNLKLLLSGKALLNGRTAQYSYTIKGIAAGDNTTGVNGGDTGAASSVSVAGVALPDVEPTQASAWSSVTYLSGDGTGTPTKKFVASVKANSSNPCGSQADFAVELFAQKVGSPSDSAEKVASGVPSDKVSGADYALTATQTGTDIITQCNGLSTNLYLKLSCTDNAPTNNKGTSYKIVTIESMIPSSPYQIQGTGGNYRCENSAVDGFIWDDGTPASKLPKLGISAVFASAAPAIQSSGTFAEINQATCEALAADAALDAGNNTHVEWTGTEPECRVLTTWGVSQKITGISETGGVGYMSTAGNVFQLKKSPFSHFVGTGSTFEFMTLTMSPSFTYHQ